MPNQGAPSGRTGVDEAGTGQAMWTVPTTIDSVLKPRRAYRALAGFSSYTRSCNRAKPRLAAMAS